MSDAVVGAGLAAVLVAATACLLVPPMRQHSPGRAGSRRWNAWSPTVAGVAALSVALLVVVASPQLAALSVILGVAASGAAHLLRARRARAAAVATAGRVVETCEQLAAELAAGSPPGSALDRAASDWSALAPVAEAVRVGADVPLAWSAAAAEPGAGSLRLVGAAWQVAHRAGAGLAESIERVGTDLRSAQGTRRIVDGELASARATARLVAVLPVVALGMGSGAGGDPWGFLLGTLPGLLCLAAGLVFGLTGLGWIELIARDVDRTP